MSTTIMTCCHLQVLESLELHPKPTVATGGAVGSAVKAGFAAEKYGQKPLEEPLLDKA